jgi:hypothetical protein
MVVTNTGGAMELSAADALAIQWLRNAIACGKHWYVALLESIRLWSSPQEDYDGRHYRYLIDNEAFDWLLLAERLCEEIDGLIPEDERIALLFFDRPPLDLSRGEFRDLIGASKYRNHLSYFYGVVVEEFLILAVTEAIRKERRVSGLTSDDGVLDEAHRRIYGADHHVLLERFRAEMHYPQRRSVTLGQVSEFTYWLFKLRIRRCDKSCVASDTKKALAKLHELLRLNAARHQSLKIPDAGSKLQW